MTVESTRAVKQILKPESVFQCLFLIHKTEKQASLSLYRKLAHIPYNTYSHLNSRYVKSEGITLVHVQSGRDTEALWSGQVTKCRHFTSPALVSAQSGHETSPMETQVTVKLLFLLYLNSWFLFTYMIHQQRYFTQATFSSQFA